jgi:hypothetical protein
MAEIKYYTAKGILNFPEFVIPRSYDNASSRYIEDLKGGSFQTGLFTDEATAQQVGDIETTMLEEFKKTDKYKTLLQKGYEEIERSCNYIRYNEDGKCELKFKRAAFNRLGNPAKIEIFDGMKTPVPTEVVKEIGNGTKARVIYCVYDWAVEKTDRDKKKYISYGITLCLLGVQILELRRKSSIMDFLPDDELSESSYRVDTTLSKFGEVECDEELPF